MKLEKYLTSPEIALTAFSLWILIFIYILGMMGAFSKNFLHFGPSTDEETSTVFLGTKIDSWEKVIKLYVLGFLTAIMGTYYHSVFKSWSLNQVRDLSVKHININKTLANIMIILDPLVTNISSILGLFLTLTLQLQFLVPQMLGRFIASVLVSRAYLKNKKSFKK